MLINQHIGDFGKSRTSRIDTETASNSEFVEPENLQTMHNQRTTDLLANISRHAPKKKVTLYKEAFLNAEPLKIRKFQDKMKRHEETSKYVSEKHDEILKLKTIKNILKREQKKEIAHNKDWYNTLVHKERSMRKEIVESKSRQDFDEKQTKRKFIKKCHSEQQLKKNATVFYNAFAQAKNVIEKQIRLVNRIKSRNMEYKELADRVKAQKTYRGLQTKPIMMKNFDNSF